MSVTYDGGTKDGRMQAVNNYLNNGGSPQLYLGASSSGPWMVNIPVSFSEGSQRLTLNGSPSATVYTTGTATYGVLTDGAGNWRVYGLSVGAGGGDINLSTNYLVAGQVVQINSGVIYHY